MTRKQPTKAQSCTTSLSALKDISAANRTQYGKAQRTQKAYAYQVEKGRAFLAESTKQCWEGLAEADDGIDTDLWEKAFDNPPNGYSAQALELFLGKRCFEEGCGLSTGEAIHAAFAHYWDNMYVSHARMVQACSTLLTSSWTLSGMTTDASQGHIRLTKQWEL
jgi:hypothetical protein